MTCPLCNDTGNQRYWEGRWRDDQKVIAALRLALHDIVVMDERRLTGRQKVAQAIEVAQAALEANQ